MIAGGTDAESAAKGLLNIPGYPELNWQKLLGYRPARCTVLCPVKRPAGLKAIIYVQYFSGATLSFGSAVFLAQWRNPGQTNIYSPTRSRRRPSRAAA